MKISLLKIIDVFKYCYQVSKNQYFSSHTAAVFLGFMDCPYLKHPKCRFGHYWPLAIILTAKCYSIFLLSLSTSINQSLPVYCSKQTFFQVCIQWVGFLKPFYILLCKIMELSPVIVWEKLGTLCSTEINDGWKILSTPLPPRVRPRKQHRGNSFSTKEAAENITKRLPLMT